MTGDEHLDLDTLADYTGDILDGERAGEVSTHLAECPRCRARVDELTGVSRLLAEAPTPHIPDHVAVRLQEAIAEAGQDRTVVPLTRSGGRRRSYMWIGSAAAAVVAVAVAGGVVGGMQETATFGDGSAGQGAQGGSASLHQESTASSNDGRALAGPDAGEVTSSVTASGRDYSSRGLPRQASELVREETGKPDVSVQMAQPTPSRLRPLSEPHRLATCVSRVTGGDDDRVLAIDLASYSGRPAAIIVASGTRPAGADVWVVDPSCSRVRAHAELPHTG